MAKAPILGNDPFQRGAAPRPATGKRESDVPPPTPDVKAGPPAARAKEATAPASRPKPRPDPKAVPGKSGPVSARPTAAAKRTAAVRKPPEEPAAAADASPRRPRKTTEPKAPKGPRRSPSPEARPPAPLPAPPVAPAAHADAAPRPVEVPEARPPEPAPVFEGELVDEIPSKRSLVPNAPFDRVASPRASPEQTAARPATFGGRLWQALGSAVERAGALPLLQRVSEELAVHPAVQRLSAVTAQAARVASPAFDWAARMIPPAMGMARAAVGAVASGEATRSLTGAAIEAGVAVGKLSRRVEPASVEVDPFGEDPGTVARFEPIFDFLHDRYFRIEVLGAPRLPKGASLLACNHSGALPLDGPMLRTVLRRECGRQDARWLVEDAVFHAPFMGVSLNRLGAVRACPENAERLLAMGLPLAVFPEGLLGLSKGFGRRYQLQRFGRGGFVKLAMRTGVPIVPVAIVGAEESFPLLGRISLRRASVPYLPVTPLLPLPMKWTVSFLDPVDLSAFGPKGAEDLALVSRLSAEIRDSIQHELDRIVGQRRRRFEG